MALAHQERMDTTELMRKRLQILVGAKIRQKNRVTTAIKIQDELYAKYSNLSETWNGSKEIRKWRDRRK